MSNEQTNSRSLSSRGMGRIFRWVLYTLLISLLPFLFVALMAFFFGRPITFELLTEGGEMMIVATVLAFSSLGELNLPLDRYQEKQSMMYSIIQIFTVVIGATSAFLYGVITVGAQSITPETVVSSSFALLILAAFSGILCVAYE